MSTRIKPEDVMKDGFLYSKRATHTKNGKKRLSDAMVPKPTAETLQAYIDAHIIADMDYVCKRFVEGEAIRQQAQIRAADKSGKIPKADYNRLFNKLATPEAFQQAIDEGADREQFINELIQSAYNEELETGEPFETA